MIDESTQNKNYPLPHPTNIASQDVARIATALTMIDANISECSSSINSINNTVQNLDAKSLRIPTELVGQVNTELTNIQPRRYVVVNEDASGFSTVEGGGGEGGKKGELLVKKSDKNFDTTWIDPRAILKKASTVKEVVSDVQLPNNGTMILADVHETDLRDDFPRHGLTQRQINLDTTADSSYTYILCDEIDDTAEDESDIATREKFGRVKIGSGINVNNGEISVPQIGVASENDFGLVKIGSGLNVNNGVISAKEYPQASRTEYGTVKLSDDFKIGNDGELLLANEINADEIIYQAGRVKICINGIVSLESTCAKYRAYITEDTFFSIDWSQIHPEDDLAFELELYADTTRTVTFESSVVWKVPCTQVGSGVTKIRFEKALGSNFVTATMIENNYDHVVESLTTDDTDDIQENFVCGTNGCVDSISKLFTEQSFNRYDGGFTADSASDRIIYMDFFRSTLIEYVYLWSSLWSGLSTTFFVAEGSNDKENWTVLYQADSETQVLDTNIYLTKTGHFKHYRIRFKSLIIRGIRLYGIYVGVKEFSLEKLIPAMSSDSENGYSITSGGINDGNLYNITTNTITTYANFSVRDGDNQYWIKYELPEAKAANYLDLGSHVNEKTRFPKWFKLEGSNDDTNWNLLIEVSNMQQWNGGETRQYEFENNIAYRYYKFTPLEIVSNEFRIARFRLYRKR